MSRLNASQVSADVDETNSSPEVTIGFGNVTNDTMVLTIDTSVDVTAFDISVQSMLCDYGFGGAAEDASFSVSTANNIGMAHSSGCNILGYFQGEGTSYIPAGTNEDLTSWSYLGGSEEICIMHAFYATEVGGDWLEADLDANYCLDYTFVYPEDSWGHWFELNEDQSKLEIDEYGISEHDTVLWAFQNSPYFSTLLQALEMTNLKSYSIMLLSQGHMDWTWEWPTTVRVANTNLIASLTLQTGRQCKMENMQIHLTTALGQRPS